MLNAIAICAMFILYNNTDLKITEHDFYVLKQSAKSCEREYSTCLSRFHKLGEREYHAVCE